jgi:hypothetical protein
MAKRKAAAPKKAKPAAGKKASPKSPPRKKPAEAARKWGPQSAVVSAETGGELERHASPIDDAASKYSRRKNRERDRQADQSRAGRDIAPDWPGIKPEDQITRARLSKSLKAFCLETMPDKFAMEFSADHKKAIAKMERAILEGEQFALAMPRGSGKTTLIVACVIWAILNGHKRYVSLIGADKKAAAKLLAAVKVQLETNAHLLRLYPDAVYPIRCLNRIANRCKGQHWGEAATYISWTAEQIILATIPGAACSGAIIEVAGILGRVRGQQHDTPNGETLRPDCFVVDDPQTNKSARSRTGVDQRLEIITGVCPGLAGPGQEISGFCLCTVVEIDDVADQLLDQDKWEEWQGERFKLVYEWPTNVELWEEYANLRAEGLAKGLGLKLATEFYRKNRKAMDAGAVVAWDSRHTKKELSAIQHAWNLRLKLKDAFWKEYQNEPIADDAADDLLSVDEIQAKTNGYKRNVLPRDANLITGYVDVQDTLLYWLVLGVRKSDFSAWVLNYGTWPKQSSLYFSLSGAAKTLKTVYPKMGREGRVRAGLMELTKWLAGERWFMPDNSTSLALSRLMIDAAWGYSTRTVQAVCLEAPHKALLLPSFGVGIHADDAPMDRWKPKPGEIRGLNWRVKPSEGGGVHATLDTNYWKNFVHARLGVATGDAGALSLFAPEQLTTHRMIAEHCRAETRSESATKERVLQVWKLPDNKPDNHFYDCLCGSFAAAAIEGASLSELRVGAPVKRKRRKTELKV